MVRPVSFSATVVHEPVSLLPLCTATFVKVTFTWVQSSRGASFT